MEFIDQIKKFTERISNQSVQLATEEATKTALVMPFFQMLGYDVFNTMEFVPEYTADYGTKKGEKVDYAIMSNGDPIILIECKCYGEPLDKHGAQLFRYFSATTVKFGILTDGRYYHFFTDLEKANIMDDKPFMIIDMLNIKDSQVIELKKFHKQNFNVDVIFDSASELKYTNAFKSYFADLLQEPTDDFIKFFVSSSSVYTGKCTQKVIDKFKNTLKKALNSYIAELMSDKIKGALASQEDTNTIPNISVQPVQQTQPTDTVSDNGEHKIVTTEEEIEAYFIVKSILKPFISDISEITYKDNERYMAIIYKGKVTKWVCRFYFNGSKKFITIPDDSKKEQRFDIDKLTDIENYSDQLIESLKRYL